MADDDDDICPLCCEELDISDKNFIPCKCGYRVCMWCWHHIKDNLNGLCPACRTPYTDDPHAFAAVDHKDVVKTKKEKKKEKEKAQTKKVPDPSFLRGATGAGAKAATPALAAAQQQAAGGMRVSEYEPPPDRNY